MEVEIAAIEDGVSCIRLRGRLDAIGAERIELRFTAATVTAGRPAVVDLSGVDYIASMGLRVLLATAKAMRTKRLPFVLYGAPPAVQSVFDDAAIGQIIAIAADEAGARQLASAG